MVVARPEALHADSGAAGGSLLDDRLEGSESLVTKASGLIDGLRCRIGKLHGGIDLALELCTGVVVGLSRFLCVTSFLGREFTTSRRKLLIEAGELVLVALDLSLIHGVDGIDLRLDAGVVAVCDLVLQVLNLRVEVADQAVQGLNGIVALADGDITIGDGLTCGIEGVLDAVDVGERLGGHLLNLVGVHDDV